MSIDKLYIAFLWHMHQPYYGDPNSNKAIMPWTRLHALKDYVDMPLLVESVDGMKATFNLVPVLIEQIKHYCEGEMRDTHQELFALEPNDMSPEGKDAITDEFFSVHRENFIETSPRYFALLKKRDKGIPLENQEIIDLQVHFELAWFGESLKAFPEIAALIRKDSNYTPDDKKLILAVEKKRLNDVIPTYKRLIESGRIEITTSPYYHPILPLLCNIQNSRLADPSSPLPNRDFAYPQDAKEHIQRGLDYIEEVFRCRPDGVWPSEGSVSEDMLSLMIQEQVKWIATDEEILRRSFHLSSQPMKMQQPQSQTLFRPYTIQRRGKKIAIFFRDHRLSDKIGFDYSHWSAKDAVSDFIQNLERIADSLAGNGKRYIVPIVLDGENAWEYFPDNGKEFLTRLYTAITEHPHIEPVTFSEFLKKDTAEDRLERLATGSWINGNFRTWSGNPDKNRAWELLSDVRYTFERKKTLLDKQTAASAFRHIMIAEGSDWFWWFGEGNYTPHIALFDGLFRSHLGAAMKKMGETLFEGLEKPIHRGEKPVRPVRLPLEFISPSLDGLATNYYEWASAGFYESSGFRGVMYSRTGQLMLRVYFGFDTETLYLRIDTPESFRIDVLDKSLSIVVIFALPEKHRIIIRGENGKAVAGGDVKSVKFGAADVLELALPFDAIGAVAGDTIHYSIELLKGKKLIERFPGSGMLTLIVPDNSFEERMWYV